MQHGWYFLDPTPVVRKYGPGACRLLMRRTPVREHCIYIARVPGGALAGGS